MGGLQHRQPHQAVVQQDGIPLLHIAGQVGVGDGAAVGVALQLRGGQGELLACRQADGALREIPQPDLRPLGVQHGGHRGVQLLPQGLQHFQPGIMLFVGAVGKVEAGHVHARQDHLPQDPVLIRGRS